MFVISDGVVLFAILVSYIVRTNALTCPTLQTCNDCYLQNARQCSNKHGDGTTTEAECAALLNSISDIKIVTYTASNPTPCLYYLNSCTATLHYIMSMKNTISIRLGGCSNGCSEVTMTTNSGIGVDASIPPDDVLTFSSREECTSHCVNVAFGGNDCTGVYSGTTCSIYTSCPSTGCPTTSLSNAEYDTIMCDHAVISCPIPTDPVNGVAVYTTTLVGDTANYACDPGFSVSGQSPLLCQSDGSWDSNAPTCLPDAIVNCVALTNPANGSVNTSGTTYPSTAYYSCNDGYLLSGFEVRTCEADGNWTDTMPSCDIVHCGQPSVIPDGEYTITSEYFMGIAQYKCNEGFSLSEVIVRTCLANGTWNGTDPSCNPVNCSLPSIINDGITDFTTTIYNSTVNYTCNIGFSLVGPDIRTCNSNGSWSGDDPYCASGCGPPKNITYGEVTHNQTVVNSKAMYSCNVTGCTISAPNFVTCLANYSWSLPTPFCTCITCASLNNISNGIVSTTNDNDVGSKASYICDPGYELSSPNIRICQQTGQWSTSEPSCNLKTTVMVPGALYVAACLCNNNREFVNMTDEEIITLLTESTRIDESQTTIAQQKLNSKMDGRVSSTIVGAVGSAILAGSLCFILILDCKNIVDSFRQRHPKYKSS